MAVAIAGEVAMIGDLTIIGGLGIIMSIKVTENALTTEAVITGTTSIKGTDMNITAIGAHGMSGTGMPEDVPTYINMAITTVIIPI